MPTISEKELERYKRIEDLAERIHKHWNSRYPNATIEKHAYLKSRLAQELKPLSNRPSKADYDKIWEKYATREEIAVGWAVVLLEALWDEIYHNVGACFIKGEHDGIEKSLKKIEQWIEEYKAER